MESINVRESRRKLRAQLKNLTWLGETQAALGWAVILVLAAVVGTLYVGQASRIAATGRSVQLMQRDLEDLRRENGVLEREIAEAQALGQLESRARSLGFVRAQPEEIEYIVVEDYPVQPTAAPQPAVTAGPLPEPANTIWQALWFSVVDSLRNMVEGEASGS